MKCEHKNTKMLKYKGCIKCLDCRMERDLLENVEFGAPNLGDWREQIFMEIETVKSGKLKCKPETCINAYKSKEPSSGCDFCVRNPHHKDMYKNKNDIGMGLNGKTNREPREDS